MLLVLARLFGLCRVHAWHPEAAQVVHGDLWVDEKFRRRVRIVTVAERATSVVFRVANLPDRRMLVLIILPEESILISTVVVVGVSSNVHVIQLYESIPDEGNDFA